MLPLLSPQDQRDTPDPQVTGPSQAHSGPAAFHAPPTTRSSKLRNLRGLRAAHSVGPRITVGDRSRCGAHRESRPAQHSRAPPKPPETTPARWAERAGCTPPPPSPSRFVVMYRSPVLVSARKDACRPGWEAGRGGSGTRASSAAESANVPASRRRTPGTSSTGRSTATASGPSASPPLVPIPTAAFALSRSASGTRTGRAACDAGANTWPATARSPTRTSSIGSGGS